MSEEGPAPRYVMPYQSLFSHKTTGYVILHEMAKFCQLVLSFQEYCSSKCLKRAQRRDIGQQNYSDQVPCTVCQNVNLNRYEFVSNQESYQLCSDPCLNVYKYANKVKAGEFFSMNHVVSCVLRYIPLL